MVPMRSDNLAGLEEAIAVRAPAVLSLPSSGAARHIRTHFVCRADEGVWISAAEADRSLLADLIGASQRVAVSFRAGLNRVAFTSRLLQWSEQLPAEVGHTAAAVLLDFPKETRISQRRNHYRVGIDSSSDLQVRAWRIADDANYRARPLPSQEIAAEARNLSVGGMGLRLRPRDGELLDLAPGDRLRLSLVREEIEIVLEARIRHAPRRVNGAIEVGVVFSRADGRLDARQALARITLLIGQMQREEARRNKLGLSA